LKWIAGLPEPIYTGPAFLKITELPFCFFINQTVFDSAQTDNPIDIGLLAFRFYLSSHTLKLFSLLCLLFKKA